MSTPGLSGIDLDRVRRAGAVEQGCAVGVARLQGAKVLLVAISHNLTGADRMVEADRVADFVGQGVTQIIDREIAVKADLPTFCRIETNPRQRNRFDAHL